MVVGMLSIKSSFSRRKDGQLLMRLTDCFGRRRSQEVVANLVCLSRRPLGDGDRRNTIYGIGIGDHGHFIRRQHTMVGTHVINRSLKPALGAAARTRCGKALPI